MLDTFLLKCSGIRIIKTGSDILFEFTLGKIKKKKKQTKTEILISKLEGKKMES